MFFGLLGVQMCQTWSDIFTILLAVPLGIGILKELKEMEKSVESQNGIPEKENV